MGKKQQSTDSANLENVVKGGLAAVHACHVVIKDAMKADTLETNVTGDILRSSTVHNTRVQQQKKISLLLSLQRKQKRFKNTSVKILK